MTDTQKIREDEGALNLKIDKLRGEKDAAEQLMAAALLREELLLSQLAQMEAETDQLSEDGNKVIGGVVTLLDRIGSLQAENDRLRAGMRSAAAVIDAYIQDFADIQTADGIDAADTYTAIRSLLEGQSDG